MRTARLLQAEYTFEEGDCWTKSGVPQGFVRVGQNDEDAPIVKSTTTAEIFLWVDNAQLIYLGADEDHFCSLCDLFDQSALELVSEQDLRAKITSIDAQALCDMDGLWNYVVTTN